MNRSISQLSQDMEVGRGYSHTRFSNTLAGGSNKEVRGKPEIEPIAMELRIRRVGWARRIAEQIHK